MRFTRMYPCRALVSLVLATPACGGGSRHDKKDSENTIEKLEDMFGSRDAEFVVTPSLKLSATMLAPTVDVPRGPALISAGTRVVFWDLGTPGGAVLEVESGEWWTIPPPDAEVAAYGPAATANEGGLFVFGGTNGDGVAVATGAWLSFATKTWRTLPTGGAPAGGSGSRAFADGERILVLDQNAKRVSAYLPDDDAWTSLPVLPTAMDQTSFDTSMIGKSGDLYAFSDDASFVLVNGESAWTEGPRQNILGSQNYFVNEDRIVAYSPYEANDGIDTWLVTGDAKWEDGADFPDEIEREVFAHANDGSHLYFFGGESAGLIGERRGFADGFIYETASDRWLHMAIEGVEARLDAAAVVAGGYLVVWGGHAYAPITEVPDAYEGGFVVPISDQAAFDAKPSTQVEPSPLTGGDFPTCAAGEMRLTGTLQGKSIDVVGPGNHLLMQVGRATFQASLGSGGPVLSATYPGSLSTGSGTKAWFTYDDALSGASGANCRGEAPDSEFYIDEDGFRFVLRELRPGKDQKFACTETALTDVIFGCIKGRHGQH